jgi:hypothetical protein
LNFRLQAFYPARFTVKKNLQGFGSIKEKRIYDTKYAAEWQRNLYAAL